jgi:hypothetical protein
MYEDDEDAFQTAIEAELPDTKVIESAKNLILFPCDLLCLTTCTFFSYIRMHFLEASYYDSKSLYKEIQR